VIPANGTVTVDGPDVTRPPGDVPDATAVSTTLLAITSVGVVVYVDVKVAVPPATSVAVVPEHDEPAPVVDAQFGAVSNVPDVVAPAWSATDTPVRVVLPVLVTKKL
jgi:hypothetical protein